MTGLNTNFTQGTSKADFGDGITVEALTVLSSTRAQASIRADRLAQVGTRQVRMLGTSEVPSVVAFTMERGSASVSGTVIDLFTQQPLANARRDISGTTISVLTDDQGRFTLEGIPPGTGTLIVTLPNYDVRRFSVTVGPNESMPLTDPILLNALLGRRD